MLEQLPDLVGHALRGRRAGLDALAMHRLDQGSALGAIDLRSLAFADHAPIPSHCTADGPGVSPPLHWTGVPSAAASLVLIVEDADSPTPQPLVHAIVVGLAPADGALAEGALASPDHEGVGLQTGKNSFLRDRWLPPDPPPGHGVHRYAFQLFALDAAPSFSDSPGREEVVDALRANAIAHGCLIGTYERPDGSDRETAVAATAAPRLADGMSV